MATFGSREFDTSISARERCTPGRLHVRVSHCNCNPDSKFDPRAHSASMGPNTDCWDTAFAILPMAATPDLCPTTSSSGS